MEATLITDAPSPEIAAAVLINREVYDALATAQGYPSIVDRAKWHGMNRSNLFDILAGRTVPRLDTAMGMARDCKTTVDALFRWAA